MGKRVCVIGAGPSVFAATHIPPYLVREALSQSRPASFEELLSDRLLCANPRCAFLAHGDPIMLGYCCACCYKQAWGVPCNYFHGGRCDRVLGAVEGRNPQVRATFGDTHYEILEAPDVEWYASVAGRGGLDLPRSDWLELMAPTDSPVKNRTVASLLAQLLLLSPPTQEPLVWATAIKNRLEAAIAPSSSVPTPGSLTLPYYASGCAPAPWGEIVGSVVVPDLLEALRSFISRFVRAA